MKNKHTQRLWRTMLACFSLGFLATPLVAATKIYVLSVGYGSLIHIQSDDADFLIDTGPAEHAMELLQHLSETRVTRLQAIFLTHIYPEHAGALEKICEQFQVDAVGWNGQDEDGPQTAEFLQAVKPADAVRVLTPGQVFAVNSQGATLRVLANSLADSPSPDDHGLAFLLTDGKTRLFFPGDASLARQRDLAVTEKKNLKNVRWMVWPGHGNTMAEELLNVMPHLKFGIVTMGKDNAKLPTPVALEQATTAGVELLTTGDGGPFTFYVSDDVRLLAVNPSR